MAGQTLVARFQFATLRLMSRFICSIATLLAIGRILAAERHFDFSGAKANESPAGFRSVVTGEGKPGEWKVIADETSSGVAATNATASLVIKHQVLAQLSQDSTDEHFPLLIFDGEVFNDFVLTTRFKTVGGDREQMAFARLPHVAMVHQRLEWLRDRSK